MLSPSGRPGRPGTESVPDHTDFMDLDEKVARRQAKKLARPKPERRPWYRRLFSAGGSLSAHDEEGRMARIDRADGSKFERGDDGRFSGEVWLRGTPADADGTSVAMVHFSPSGRTHWHQHPGGQFLVGVTGRGRVRSRDESAPLFLESGDILHIDAGEWHFHGAEPDAPMVHVAVSKGGSPEWGDPVTDEEYETGV